MYKVLLLTLITLIFQIGNISKSKAAAPAALLACVGPQAVGCIIGSVALGATYLITVRRSDNTTATYKLSEQAYNNSDFDLYGGNEAELGTEMSDLISDAQENGDEYPYKPQSYVIKGVFTVTNGDAPGGGKVDFGSQPYSSWFECEAARLDMVTEGTAVAETLGSWVLKNTTYCAPLY